DEHREAARTYIDFLLARPQQLKAMAHGFRPGDEKIDLAAPLDRAHGIDPDEPKNLFLVPPAEVMIEVLKLWQANKKQARVVLVIDTSNSMNREQRLIQAKAGALELLQKFGKRDVLSLMEFNSEIKWHDKYVPMDGAGRKRLAAKVNALSARRQTLLYD